MATLDQVLAQMAAHDMPPLPAGHPLFDGRIHRFGPKNKAWYVLHEYVARNQQRYIAGAFGIWQGTENNSVKVQSDFAGIEPDEYQRLQRSQVELEAKERRKREDRAAFAASRALQQWKGARARLSEGEENAYLKRKRLQWENGLRQAPDGTLYVPMVRYDVTEEQAEDPDYTGPRRLAGLQKIAPDGSKFFNRGMNPIGAACRFGRKPKDGDLLLIGEGVATVLSAHQACERVYTSYAAFTAGNLPPIARILRALYPRSPILILADDDAYLEAQLNKRLRDDYGVHELYKLLDAERTIAAREGCVTVRADVHEDTKRTPLLTVGIRVHAAGQDPSEGRLRILTLKNAGRTKAWEAAGEVGNAWAFWPHFRERSVCLSPEGPRETDWNDLHCTEGLSAVVAQLGDAVATIEQAHNLSQQISAGAPTPTGGASGGKDGGGGDDEPDWRLHGSLVKRFTLIERSDTAYDSERGFLWRVSHMRLTFGGKPVGMWLGSGRRRSVDLSEVVFDPTMKCNPKTTVNLYRGIELQPKAGKCEKLLELLRYLCGEDGENTEAPISEHVLNWAALPLQRPGAKMKTAIVMFGAEGTGKNLFWGALKAIYGRYAALITQAELEDKHNTWLSAKLFLIANEVVTRSEMSHHVGRLKNLITEDEVYINPKMVDQRYERNHVNLVFLSNEFQPLKISPGDRRYMVIRTPNERPESFYREVSAELDAGGAQALYQQLMERELGSFNEHTKPLMTEAKTSLIEIGMLPSQQFWQEIKEGLLPFPYEPCLSDDLYHAYTIYCARKGHRNAESQNRFTPAFMSMNGVRRIERPVPDPDRMHELRLVDETSWTKRRVFLMGVPALDHEAERKRIVDGVVAFRKALRAYQAEGGGYLSGSASADSRRDRGEAY